MLPTIYQQPQYYERPLPSWQRGSRDYAYYEEFYRSRAQAPAQMTRREYSRSTGYERRYDRRRSYSDERGYDRGYDRDRYDRGYDRYRSRSRRRRDDYRRDCGRRDDYRRDDYYRRDDRRDDRDRRDDYKPRHDAYRHKDRHEDRGHGTSGWGSRYDRQDDRREYDRSRTRRRDTRSGSSASASSASDSGKDEIVHFKWQAGQVLNDRYEVKQLLGDGTFGRVLECYDPKTDQILAVKVIRDVKRYVENADIEAQILKKVCADPESKKTHCVQMVSTFNHGRHYCMAFETLGPSLYDFLKDNNYQGFKVSDIQTIARELLTCLEFLHDKMHLTHTDLKLENLLLCDGAARSVQNPRGGRREKTMQAPLSASIKVIDFGNATFADEHHSSVINTRQYRSPEVIMGLRWDEKSDIWSSGCILMELYLGELLFSTHENLEHLKLIETIIGEIPQGMFQGSNAECMQKYLARDRSTNRYSLNWPAGASSSKSVERVRDAQKLHRQVDPKHKLLADFCSKLLTIDPSKRPSAREALQHPFLEEVLEE